MTQETGFPSEGSSSPPSLKRGAQLIADYTQTLPSTPGVYRMLNLENQALYVGKAKNLKRRVWSYTQVHQLPNRLKRMVSQTFKMEFITTHTEAEALLLEANLIKKLEPRYNILLRDDKSAPYILITQGHPYPQLFKHRGAKNKEGKYYGPFASPKSVTETLVALQKAFLLRNCSDSVFASRKRPCLQYQIKRCSAPCVAKISPEDYGDLAKQAKDFLEGRTSKVQHLLAEKMQESSENLDFETAAFYRDRIRALTQIQSHQDINTGEELEGDVIGVCQRAEKTCIQVFFFRGGRNYGNQAYFPQHTQEHKVEEIIESFIGQFYTRRTPPAEILLDYTLENAKLLSQALSLDQPYKVKIHRPQRGFKVSLLEHATRNAEEALIRYLAQHQNEKHLLEGVAQAFGLERPPERIEVYDNSHLQGRHPYGAMIVAGPEGLIKRAYRQFSIRPSQEQEIKGGKGKDPVEKARPDPEFPLADENRKHSFDDLDLPKASFNNSFDAGDAPQEEETQLTPSIREQIQGKGRTGAECMTVHEHRKQSFDAGDAPKREREGREGCADDYAMMRQVIRRRFQGSRKGDAWPDLLVIDGGLGQLNAVQEVLNELNITSLPVVAIAKGPQRNAGKEKFFMEGRAPFSLSEKDPVLYYLQRLRDEAHRFVITTHRRKRTKTMVQSLLDTVPQIGSARKKSLLNHFGSAQGVIKAGIRDLEAVPGISKELAKKLYTYFQGG
jgi:excinuclease ABC subunit C